MKRILIVSAIVIFAVGAVYYVGVLLAIGEVSRPRAAPSYPVLELETITGIEGVPQSLYPRTYPSADEWSSLLLLVRTNGGQGQIRFDLDRSGEYRSELSEAILTVFGDERHYLIELSIREKPHCRADHSSPLRLRSTPNIGAPVETALRIGYEGGCTTGAFVWVEPEMYDPTVGYSLA